MRFSQGSIPERLVQKKITIHKVIQCLLKQVTSIKISIKRTWFQQTLNNFVNCDFFFNKLSGIYPCEKKSALILINTYILRVRVSRRSHKNLEKISLAPISLGVFSIDFQSQTFVQYAETVEREKIFAGRHSKTS